MAGKQEAGGYETTEEYAFVTTARTYDGFHMTHFGWLDEAALLALSDIIFLMEFIGT